MAGIPQTANVIYDENCVWAIMNVGYITKASFVKNVIIVVEYTFIAIIQKHVLL